MPDPTPNDGFTFHLNEAEKAVTKSLPAAAELLNQSASAVSGQDWLGGSGRVDQAATAQYGYLRYKDLLARRQCQVMDSALSTAEALREVIEVYRRADGQV